MLGISPAVFVVIADANALHDINLTSILILLHQTGLIQLKWTQEIEDEAVRSLLKRGLDEAKVLRRFEMMREAVLDHEVDDYERFKQVVSEVDEKDQHVAAAAVKCGAQTIVTFNTRDFPSDAMRRNGLIAQDPDDFLVGLYERWPAKVLGVLFSVAAAKKRPPETVREMLQVMSQRGLRQFAGTVLKDLP